MVIILVGETEYFGMTRDLVTCLVLLLQRSVNFVLFIPPAFKVENSAIEPV